MQLDAKCPSCGKGLSIISYSSYCDFGIAEDGDGLICQYKCLNNNCEVERVVVYKNDIKNK